MNWSVLLETNLGTRGAIRRLSIAVFAMLLAGCGFPQPEGPTDAAPTTDARVSGTIDAGGPTTTYSNITDSSKWGTLDIAQINAGAKGFFGVAFDGRYLYFAPHGSNASQIGIVARYDTQGSFISSASWSTFNALAVKSKAKGFIAAVFDGRYVYFVPDDNGGYVGTVVRYDTQADFSTAASWTVFDATTIDANAAGFAGGVFDGRYVYFVPVELGIILRYDTQGGFTSSGSWTVVSASVYDNQRPGYYGGVFDGRYLYLVPYIGINTTAFPYGGVARYDTQASFTAASSWTVFDVGTVSSMAKGFQGGAFDGRYLYLAPRFAGTTSGMMARYDTQAAFGLAASWTTFDVTTVNVAAKGFDGATFDGRYLYLSPNVSGTVARYDTEGSFTAVASWGTFDTTTVVSGASGFFSAAFDGRYVYFSPASSTSAIVARFDAVQPAAMPRTCSLANALYCFAGSFL
jgi:hypothetical protein